MEQQPTRQDVEEALLRKVNGLLRQAEGQKATSPEEAASYAALAAKLITKYNIDENRLRQAADQASGKVNIIMRSERLQTTQRWHKVLLTGITETNFCRYAFWPGSVRIDIWGEAHNIDACMALYTFLANEINRLSDVAYDKLVGNVEQPRQWKYNFRHGAAAVVAGRLLKQYQEMQAGTKLLNSPSDQKAIAKMVERDIRQEYGITRAEDVTPGILHIIEQRVAEAVANMAAPSASDMKALIVVQDAALVEAQKRFLPDAEESRADYFDHKKIQDRPGFKEGVRAGYKMPLNNYKQLPPAQEVKKRDKYPYEETWKGLTPDQQAWVKKEADEAKLAIPDILKIWFIDKPAAASAS